MKEQYLNILKNKYFIVTAIVLVWMTFFDSNNFIHIVNKTVKLQALKKEKNYYLEKMKETKKARRELMKNGESLERFAREKYFMKKPNEDLYVVIEEDNQHD